MSNVPETRCYSLYISTNKVAEMESSDCSLDFGRLKKFVNNKGGVIFTKGVVHGSVNFSQVSLVGGSSPDLLGPALAQKQVTLAVPIEGGTLSMPAVCTKVDWKGVVQEGSLTGQWAFEFGTPDYQKV